MNTEWKYISDQMEKQTEGNVKKAVALSLYHDSGLHTMGLTLPGLVPLYTRYHPLHLVLMDEYSNLDSSGGAQQGDRVSVTDLLALTKETLVDVWVTDILKLYHKGSARYKAIFPQKLQPFNLGGIDSKIKAYLTLSKNIGTDAALASIKVEITTAHTNLLTARNSQSDAKVVTSNTSNTLELARTNAMEMQYRNLGNIMDTFFDIREVLCPIVFDLVTLRVSPQTVFKGILKKTNMKAVLAQTFLPTATFSVMVTEASSLYLSNIIGGTDNTRVSVPANIKTLVNVTQFGVTNYTANRYLTLVNESFVEEKYSITL